MKQYTIGIDVGGTKTAYGVFDEKMNVISHLTHPSNTEYSPETFFFFFAAKIRELMASC
jgi:glucokinase